VKTAKKKGAAALRPSSAGKDSGPVSNSGSLTIGTTDTQRSEELLTSGIKLNTGRMVTKHRDPCPAELRHLMNDVPCTKCVGDWVAFPQSECWVDPVGEKGQCQGCRAKKSTDCSSVSPPILQRFSR
jgi:hypothetical protein